MPDLLYEKKKNYAVFTLNRPDKLNAISAAMREELSDAMDDFNKDPTMFAAVITGSGRAFCAGADLRAMSERQQQMLQIETDYAAGKITTEQRRDLLGRGVAGGGLGFAKSPKPFLAAVNGLAVGGGTEWAIDCDMRICSTDAYFGLWEIKRGILPGSGVLALPRVINFGDAMYVLMTADKITAEEALKMRLVHDVTTPENLMNRATQIMEMIASAAPIAVAGSKAIAQFWRQLELDEQTRYQGWVNRWVGGSEDSKEGPKAFAEKRAPVWKNK